MRQLNQLKHEQRGYRRPERELGMPSRRCWCCRTPRNLSVAVLCSTTLFLFADQNLMAPNLTAIAHDFGFDDDERDTYLGGYISTAFFVVGGCASLVFGGLSDRADLVKRRDLYALVVLIGEGACALTALVNAYWQLLILRAMTGLSVGGALPLLFSMLGDLFPPSARAVVSGVVGSAMGFGIMFGQIVAGMMGPVYGWRVPFAVVGCPPMLLALVLRFCTDEPPRAAAEPARARGAGNEVDADAAAQSYHARPSWAKVRQLLRTPTVAITYLQGIPGCIPWGTINVYLNDYMSHDVGLSVQNATWLVVAFGMGCVVGVSAGGWLGQCLYNRRNGRRLQCYFMGLTTAAGVFPMVWLIVSPRQSMGIYVPVCIFAGLVANVTGANIRAVLLNVTAPEVRGAAFSMFNLMDDVGKGLGPTFVSLFITAYGRERAFAGSMCCWLLCGVLLASLAFFVEHDERAMQAQVRAVLTSGAGREGVERKDEQVGGEVEMQAGSGAGGGSPNRGQQQHRHCDAMDTGSVVPVARDAAPTPLAASLLVDDVFGEGNSVQRDHSGARGDAVVL